MTIDLKAVHARFSCMTPDELLEEAALHAESYTPVAQNILAEVAQARGITAAQIEARRSAASPTAAPAAKDDGIELPVLLTSSDEKSHLQELALHLRERDIPAVIRELDPRAFHASGHRVGRWGLMVSGQQAAAAAHLLEQAAAPPDEETAAAGCGGGCGCSGGECDASGEEWPEDGDWWKTAPGEDDPPV